MRLKKLLPLASAIALLLPLGAHAAWPAGEKAKFMEQCTTAAKAQAKVSAADAQKHCSCIANSAASKFSEAELVKLNQPSSTDNEKLHATVLKDAQACRGQ
ncbi:hypothetical protein [Pseudomonas sp. nanlin1]|uniref:hypothetical protein n=1 Tax=Pseudomonas sp. nanlin1 TaxID=3040605 RepID=UPI00388DE243